MKAGAIEETVIPRNPLDVLAQQIVAICADEEIYRTQASPAPECRVTLFSASCTTRYT